MSLLHWSGRGARIRHFRRVGGRVLSACLCCIGSEGVPESCILAGSACSGTPILGTKVSPFFGTDCLARQRFLGWRHGAGAGGWAGLAWRISAFGLILL